MTATTHEANVLGDDPFATENLLDPYPFLGRLREAGAVSYLESTGSYAVAGYEEVYEVLTDFETYISSGGLGPRDIRKDSGWRPPSILESDPPIHTVMRRALTGVINPGTVRALRQPFTPPAVELAEQLARRDRFDAVTDLAEKYPLRVFPDAVGISDGGREHLLPYGNMVFNAFGPENYIFKQAFAQEDEHAAAVMRNCQRENLDDTGFGAQIWDRVNEGIITEQQATLLVRALLSAGVDTTIFGIGNTLSVLVRHPQAWARLRENPKLAKFAVDESLRLESPFQKFHRTVAVDTVLGGVHLPAGAKVLVFLGAANRDPRKWGDNADEFDLDRNASGHVAFGMGLHQCVGQPIARLEMEIILQQLAERVAAIEPDGAPVPILHNVLRGFESLPVRITGA
ncbi:MULTISPECIES: cytochrome P450 [unclassified Arthrobacter]|uniref:cytochrome P450 n=1 Tax=unclassified Arthrobacter TaxID=235627 RepID=UPI00159DC322|nr:MULTISPECIES: cytochrome P450 [unclassified Arthrobacter]MCQ9165921.1 cytochrome P450 [Arthrobacter sp. STN4]NVM98673.1 cytochrome P450 [Arthrobacter sp. SDTb3-6]